MSVSEVCKMIRERFGEAVGGADHGLFNPATGQWLQSSKILEFYELKSGETLIFKKRHRPFKVKTLDGTLKTIIMDESLPVQLLVHAVCEKLGN